MVHLIPPLQHTGGGLSKSSQRFSFSFFTKNIFRNSIKYPAYDWNQTQCHAWSRAFDSNSVAQQVALEVNMSLWVKVSCMRIQQAPLPRLLSVLLCTFTTTGSQLTEFLFILDLLTVYILHHVLSICTSSLKYKLHHEHQVHIHLLNKTLVWQ